MRIGYSIYHAFGHLWYSKKMNIITMIIYAIAIIFPICAIMFSSQLNENLESSKVIKENNTIVLYSEDVFTKEDQNQIMNKYNPIIEYMVPIETTLKNIIINDTLSSKLVLTTTLGFSKLNRLQLDQNVDSGKLYQGKEVIVGKDLVLKGKAKELQIGDSTYDIAATMYNYEYATYVLSFQENCSAKRMDIVIKENINLEKARNAIVNYCIKEMGKTVECKYRTEVKGTVNYYDNFLSKAILITIGIIIYSAINILSIIIMKLDEEKRGISIKFSVGARKIHIFIQKFLELFIIFSLGSLLSFLVLPVLIKILNSNLTFIVLYYTHTVVLYVVIINIVCALVLSIWYVTRINYRRVLINIKK